MTVDEAQVGIMVRALRGFPGVPAGSHGVIDQDYGTGVMIAWDLADRPLPAGYWEWSGRPAACAGEPLRDGFDKATELQLLELVEVEA